MAEGTVAGLGGLGDGIVRESESGDGTGGVFVPFVLEGEKIEFEHTGNGRGRLVRVLRPAGTRVAAVCPHFTVCGGCALQHMNETAYRDFKIETLKRTLSSFSEEADFDAPVFVPPHTRRRVTFALFWCGKMRRFGLNEAKSDRIVPVDECPLLVPELERMIAPLRSFFMSPELSFSGKKGVGDVSLLQTESGVDVLLTLPFSPDLGWRQALPVLGHALGAARISWRRSEAEPAEPLFFARAPVLTTGGFVLKPPAGCFLQPDREGEAALVGKAREYAGKSKKIVDLFCGAGTFSLGLLEKKRKIYGVDNASEALKALEAASEGRIKTENRDLFRTPLFSDELNAYDCIVFDPPRAGAKAQAEQIALSAVPVVIAVSCNPLTFVRDAEILKRGGYSLRRLTPVDQFAYSSHMELIALFTR